MSKRQGVLGASARSRSFSSRTDGPPHWQFREAEEPSGPPEVSDASVRYHDLGSERNVATELTRITGSIDPDLKLNATGKLQGEQLEITRANGAARLSRLARRARAKRPYAIEARIEAGQTKIAASGDISKPDQLQAVKIGFELTSPDVTEMRSGDAAAHTGRRKVIRTDQVWAPMTSMFRSAKPLSPGG